MKKNSLYISLLVSTIIVSSNAAIAQERSAFTRDRNISVKDRVAPEYSAIGIRGNGFTYYPKVSISTEFNDNIYFDDIFEKSATSINTTVGGAARSNWARHSLGFAGSVGYDNNIDYNKESYGNYLFGANGKYDTYGQSNLFGNVSLQSSTEPRGSEITLASAAERIKFNLSNVNLGYVHEVGRIKGTVSYQNITYNYKDVPQVGGGLLDMDYRDRTEQAIQFKGEYAYSPAISFFAMVAPGEVKYDSNTLNRDSKSFNAVIGSNFDISDFARGQITIGSYNRNFDNAAFKDGNGISLDGKVEYFFSRLTTVTIDANSSFRESAFSASSGYKYRNIGIRVDHELLKNLLVKGAVNFSNSDYNQINRNDKRNNILLGASYKLNRNLSLETTYNHRQLESDGSSAVTKYKDNTLNFGLAYTF